jgi:hypothetical protein
VRRGTARGLAEEGVTRGRRLATTAFIAARQAGGWVEEGATRRPRGGSRPDRQDVGGRQWPGRGARVCAVGTEQGRVGVTDPWAPTTVPGGGSLNLFQIQIQNEFESYSNCLKL